MTDTLLRTVLALVVTAAIALVAVQVGYGVWAPASGNQTVSIEALQEQPRSYLGQEVTIEGWYQGGLVRDANPICANGREGVQREPYNYTYVAVPEDMALYTGVKYRFTGVVRESMALNRTVPGARPVVALETATAVAEQPDNCYFGGTTDTE